MSTETTMPPKTRTITLTGRPPVKIREDQWPLIARATGDSYRGDPSRWRQAVSRGEIDTYSLRVRQHADGRTLVYGVLDAAIAAWGQPAGGESHRGGVLLTPPPADAPGRWTWEGTIDDQPVALVIWPEIAQAIQRVGRECGLPDAVIRACLADLPAEAI